MRQRKPTPPRMVVDGKVAEYGAFVEPLREANLLDADLRIGGLKAPWLIRDFRLKEWEHFGFITEDYYFGMVIFDAKFMGLSFFYVFNRKTGEHFEHSRNGGLTRVGRELWHAECTFKHLGYSMEFENRLDRGFHRISARIKGKPGKPGIEAELFMLEDPDRFEPLVQVSPVSENRPFYTHKAAAPAEGFVSLGGKRVELNPERDVCVVDVQKTFYPYRMFWDWATFAGYDDSGRLLAMNSCQNFMTDDEDFNENCTWVDGKITLLGAVRFDFDMDELMKPWKVRAPGGGLDLTFTPEGDRFDRFSVGVAMSDFHQLLGRFNGTMTSPGGAETRVENLFGICEWHVARF